MEVRTTFRIVNNRKAMTGLDVYLFSFKTKNIKNIPPPTNRIMTMREFQGYWFPPKEAANRTHTIPAINNKPRRNQFEIDVV